MQCTVKGRGVLPRSGFIHRAVRNRREQPVAKVMRVADEGKGRLLRRRSSLVSLRMLLR